MTVHFIADAIKRLRAVQIGTQDANVGKTYWRGMRDLTLDDAFMAEGGTELAPMSCTSDLRVASAHADPNRGGPNRGAARHARRSGGALDERFTARLQREAQVLLSEGQRESAVNMSEGEKQKRINEATGRAEEIRMLAEASADGLRLIAEAIQRPGGNAAVKTQLIEQFVEEYGKILESAHVSVVPAQLASIKGFFERVSQVGDAISDDPKGGR